MHGVAKEQKIDLQNAGLKTSQLEAL